MDDRPSRREIVVVGAVIVRDGLVLCAQRGPDGSLSGKWEFPGGKVEQGESGRLPLAREIAEERRGGVAVGAEIATPRVAAGRLGVGHAAADRAHRPAVGRPGRAGWAGLGAGRRTRGGAGDGGPSARGLTPEKEPSAALLADFIRC